MYQQSFDYQYFKLSILNFQFSTLNMMLEIYAFVKSSQNYHFLLKNKSISL